MINILYNGENYRSWSRDTVLGVHDKYPEVSHLIYHDGRVVDAATVDARVLESVAYTRVQNQLHLLE